MNTSLISLLLEELQSLEKRLVEDGERQHIHYLLSEQMKYIYASLTMIINELKSILRYEDHKVCTQNFDSGVFILMSHFTQIMEYLTGFHFPRHIIDPYTDEPWRLPRVTYSSPQIIWILFGNTPIPEYGSGVRQIQIQLGLTNPQKVSYPTYFKLQCKWMIITYLHLFALLDISPLLTVEPQMHNAHPTTCVHRLLRFYSIMKTIYTNALERSGIFTKVRNAAIQKMVSIPNGDEVQYTITKTMSLACNVPRRAFEFVVRR